MRAELRSSSEPHHVREGARAISVRIRHRASLELYRWVLIPILLDAAVRADTLRLALSHRNDWAFLTIGPFKLTSQGAEE